MQTKEQKAIVLEWLSDLTDDVLCQHINVQDLFVMT